MLHPIALDYSCINAAHGRLRVYVITVILFIHSYTIINTGVLTSCRVPDLDLASGHYFTM